MRLPFNLTICCLLAVLLREARADPSCIYTLKNGEKLDIRPLGLANGKGPKYDNIPNSVPMPHTFNWNGCFPYSKAKGDCKNAAACYTNTNSGESTAIAKPSDAEFEDHGNVYTLVYHTPKAQLTVYLTCREEDEERINGRQDDHEIFNIYLTSRCCCPGKCHYSAPSGSLSGGAVFIIILLVVLAVYLAGGMLFLRYSRGARGAEMIPNRVMWLGVVAYAVDGMRYSIQVVRQKSLNVNYEKI